MQETNTFQLTLFDCYLNIVQHIVASRETDGGEQTGNEDKIGLTALVVRELRGRRSGFITQLGSRLR